MSFSANHLTDLQLADLPVVIRPYGKDKQRTALDWKTGWLDQILGMRALLHPEDSGFHFLDKTGKIERTLSVQTLDLEAKKAAGMIANYVKAGSRIVLLGGNNPEFFISFFGIIYAGCIPVSGVSPALSGAVRHLKHILKDSQPEAVIGLKEDLSGFSPFCSDFGGKWLAIDDREDFAPFFKPLRESRQAAAFIQYTSGTEGKPRGVPVSHEGISINLHRQAEEVLSVPTGAGLTWLPFTHDMGLIMGLFFGLASGNEGYIQQPEHFIQNPAGWLEAISSYAIRSAAGPVFAYDLAVEALEGRADHLDLSCWQVACVGSGPLHALSLQKFIEVFQENGFLASTFRTGYGMAETTLMISSEMGLKVKNFLRSEMAKGSAVPARAEDKESEITSLVSCGKILPDHALRLRNPATDQWLEEGKIGDIWVTGPCVAKSYIGTFEREGNSKTQRPMLFEQDQAGEIWFRTGDSGFLLEGELFVIGRVEDAVIQEGKIFDPYDLAEEVRYAVRSFQAENRQSSRIEAIVIYQEAGNLHVLIEVAAALKEERQAALAASRRLFEICGTRSIKVFFLPKGGLARTPNGKLRFKASAEKIRLGDFRTYGEYMFGARDLKTTEYEELEWLIP
ncbi:fatty acyl-AMP ligase [Acetobacteraceae bacterium]|nr:fatty acyl-AMP ligase [Acetobacteraceae bacterium]